MTNIRYAKASDAKEIKSVAKKTWKATYDSFLEDETIEKVIENWYRISDLRKQTKDPLFFVAVDEKQVVGFIHATAGNKDKGVLELHRIYILPDYWLEGLGSKLLDKVLQEGEEIEIVTLEVLEGNEGGKQFYRSKGFEVVEKEEVRLFGQPVTQTVMQKEL